MNLFARIILLFAVISLLVFVAGGIISYRVMKREVDAEQQRFLVERLDRATDFIKRRLPEDTVRRNQLMIVPLEKLREESLSFSDTLAMHSQLERIEPHLKLRSVRNFSGRSFAIEIYGVVVESDDIQDAVIESLLKTYLILLGVILAIGAGASYIMLRPFRQTLDVIKSFSLKSPEKTHFPTSSVNEFKRLNEFLDGMAAKVKRDYHSLKEFSENASHELQTPLAIAQTKLELLLDQDLTQQQVEQITHVQSALKRMSNLSSSLSILTKIDNKEFNKIEEVNISNLVTSISDEFSELISLKEIVLKKDIQKDVLIHSDRTLIELLVSNLINNAIRHNEGEGFIQVKLTNASLVVRNSGADVDMDPNDLFGRFKKSNQSNQSTGLGLAIVKQICELNGFGISYGQANQTHEIQVTF